MLHWQKKPLTYAICIPPLTLHYYEMNNEEAQAYYDWFMGILDQRIEYLSKFVAAKLNCEEKIFDLSPESLIPLWKWFLTIAEKEPATVGQNDFQLSLQTEYIIRDIGMYLGKTFIKNDTYLYWTLRKKPKSDFFYNQPVIDGFYRTLKDTPVFEPIHMTRVQAVGIMDQTAKEDGLFRVYEKWEKSAIWFREHPCPKCGGTLRLVPKAFSRKEKYIPNIMQGYYCERCRENIPPSVVELPPEYRQTADSQPNVSTASRLNQRNTGTRMQKQKKIEVPVFSENVADIRQISTQYRMDQIDMTWRVTDRGAFDITFCNFRENNCDTCNETSIVEIKQIENLSPPITIHNIRVFREKDINGQYEIVSDEEPRIRFFCDSIEIKKTN